MPRRMQPLENQDLLMQAVPLRLATLNSDGYPHVTPLWFTLDGDAIVVTSYADRGHVARARTDPRVGLVIDGEMSARPDGQRPNRQIRMRGDVVVADDRGHEWMTRIRRTYLGSVLIDRLDESSHRPRALIRIEPLQVVAVASV